MINCRSHLWAGFWFIAIENDLLCVCGVRMQCIFMCNMKGVCKQSSTADIIYDTLTLWGERRKIYGYVIHTKEMGSY